MARESTVTVWGNPVIWGNIVEKRQGFGVNWPDMERHSTAVQYEQYTQNAEN